MKKMNNRWLMAAMFMAALSGHAFTSNGIIYNIVSSTDCTVEVGKKSTGSAGSDGAPGYSGNINIPEQVTYNGTTYTVVGIADEAFTNSSSMTSLTLPNTLTYIGKNAFQTCFDLTELTIPASVTSIGYGCTWASGLTKVTVLRTTPATCEYNAFSYMQYNNATLYVPYGCKSAYQNAYEWKNFPNIVESAPSLPSLNGHDYVDLGLPSGKLWATTNYGAASPSAYGNYVEWSSSDVVKSSWGSRWYTPTRDDIMELINNCTWTWGSQDGVSGYTVKGNNGNTIFLPAAGVKMGSVMNAGSWVYYWTSTPESGGMVYNLMATSSSVWYGSMNTMVQLPIRPVATPEQVTATGISVSQSSAQLTVGETLQLTATVAPSNATNKTVTWRSSNTTVATVSGSGLVTAVSAGTATITATTTDGTNLSATCQLTVKAPRIYGDINNDGVVDIADVNILINLMLGKEEPRATTETADVTGDGVVDIADVNAAINAMLGKGQIPNGFSQVEYIDVTGGQWIDTGIHADSSIEVQFTTMVAGRMANNTRFFSTHDPHPDYPEYQYPETSQLYDGWNALGTWGLSAEPNEIKIKPLGYDDLVGTNCGISDFYNQKITLVLTGTGRFSLVKDNQTLKSYDAGSLTNTSTKSNTDIRLFTRVVYDAHELFKGKVYEVTITKSNQVVMHLLPYWDNNQDVGAFYDTVSKKFFYSNSSKSF